MIASTVYTFMRDIGGLVGRCCYTVFGYSVISDTSHPTSTIVRIFSGLGGLRDPGLQGSVT